MTFAKTRDLVMPISLRLLFNVPWAAQVTTPQGKADAFLNHLLEKGALLPNQTEEGPPNKPLGSLHLPTKEHCWAALCAPPPSAPGEDGLATTAWRELWPVLGDTITQLYYRCIEEGCFPLSLKSAKIIMLPKPGKRDYTQLNAWRPISLLSTLVSRADAGASWRRPGPVTRDPYPSIPT